MKKPFLIFTFYFLLFTLPGCGYTTRSMISTKYRTVYITPFINKIDITKQGDSEIRYKIYKPLLESDVTRAVTNKFLFDGNLRPVTKESADLTFKGELIEFQREALRYDENENAEEYRISIVVDISLWDNRENKLVWQESGFRGEKTYFVTGSQAITDDTAVNEAVTDLSRRIVERTVEEW